MKNGYARLSTAQQDLTAQLDALRALGVTRRTSTSTTGSLERAARDRSQASLS